MNPEEIINEMVRILKDDDLSKDWLNPNPQSEIFGKLGTMSPLNRAAFIEAFGAQQTADYEQQAQAILKAEKQSYLHSHYHQHSLEADRNEGAPQEGDFVWCSNSGMKRDWGGLNGELHDCTCYKEHKKRLCKVVKVITIPQEDFFKSETTDKLVAEYQLQDKCGCMSEDLPDGVDTMNLTKEQYATFYTLGVAVVNAYDHKWYLIDTEGYDYCRYLYLPQNWQEMYQKQVAEIIEKENQRKAAEHQKEIDDKQQRLSDYKARCKKWQHLMTDVNPLIATEKKAYEAWGNVRYKKGTKEEELYKLAKRRLSIARRANIAAMLINAFPDVRFSINRSNGYGYDYYVTWENAMTEDELHEKTDLDLFAHGHETFDGMTDSSGYSKEEFTDFSDYTMGKGSYLAEIKAERIITDDYLESMKQVLDDLGITEENLHTAESWSKIRSLKGCEEYNLDERHTYREVMHFLSYNLRTYKPKEIPTPTTQEKTAPTSGKIEIIDYSEKAIALIGDTKPLATQLKELGGRFNSRLTCGAGWIFPKTKEEQVKSLIKQ